MKKNHSILFEIAVLLTAAIFTLAGCDTGTGGGGGGGGGGADPTITFTDSLPAMEVDYMIVVTTAEPTNYRTAVNAAENRENKTVATGAYLSTEDDVVTLSAGGTFNSNGTYTVIYWEEFRAPQIKYKTGVQFTDGNASLSFAAMTTKEYELGATGTLTFTDSPSFSGNWHIFVTSATVTNYQTAVIAASTTNGDFYAGATTGDISGNVVTLETFDDFNRNGTYTVIYVNDDTPLEMKYKSGVEFTNGNASFAFSTMATVGGEENALVISGFSQGADCAVIVVNGNPSTVTQGLMGGQPGVGVIEAGENFVNWTTTPPNGTYTILINLGGTTYKKAPGVTLTSGVGTVDYAAFVDIPLM
jgi:hypothetical protein